MPRTDTSYDSSRLLPQHERRLYAVACPYCKAEVGQPCRTERGLVVTKISEVHSMRINNLRRKR